MFAASPTGWIWPYPIVANVSTLKKKARASGPPNVEADAPAFAGYYILASVFKPESLPPLDGARGKRFYLHQGKADRVTAFQWAQTARQTLEKHGATVHLESFAGGHGFDMADVSWLCGVAR